MPVVWTRAVGLNPSESNAPLYNKELVTLKCSSYVNHIIYLQMLKLVISILDISHMAKEK